MMIHIEPLGTDVILPAFVVGYELPLPRNPDHLPELPRWIVTLDQQAGGMCMSYPSVVGAVLRLEANLERGKKNLTHLVRGLKCMAEDPKLGILRSDYPVLSTLVATSGTEYTQGQLRDLENVLSANLWMPPLQDGIEAFIRCAECDLLDYFRGWKMLGCTVRGGESRRGSIYSLGESHCYYVDDSALSDLTLTTRTSSARKRRNAWGESVRNVACLLAPVSSFFGKMQISLDRVMASQSEFDLDAEAAFLPKSCPLS